MVLCAHIRAVDLLWCERPVSYSTYVRVSTNALAGRKKEKKKVAPKGARSARLSGVGAPPDRLSIKPHATLEVMAALGAPRASSVSVLPPLIALVAPSAFRHRLSSKCTRRH